MMSKLRRASMATAYWDIAEGYAALTPDEKAIIDRPLSQKPDELSWREFSERRGREEDERNATMLAVGQRALRAGGIAARWRHYRKVKARLWRYRGGWRRLNGPGGYHPHFRHEQDKLRARKFRIESALKTGYCGVGPYAPWPSHGADVPADERTEYLLIGQRIGVGGAVIEDTSTVVTVCGACINRPHICDDIALVVVRRNDDPEDAMCEECYQPIGYMAEYNLEHDLYADSFGDTR